MPRPALSSKALRARLWCLPFLLLWPFAEPARAADDWREALRAQVERIDRASPGKLGVYVKRLADGQELKYDAGRLWYLSSTVKVPVAIAVLQQVDAGRLRLDQQLAMQETDKVDGSGALVWQPPGSRYTVDSLIKRMLRESDNTGTNLLIRTIGQDKVDRVAEPLLGQQGFQKLTDMTQVRYDVYAELSPEARKLSNHQLVEIAGAPMGPKRVDAVRRALGLQPGDLQAKTMDEAYARYYRGNLNAATLEAYGGLLEQLVRGKLLSPQSTRVLFVDMSFESMGDYRLQGGLPKTVRFIHKTGTQHRRACHMGVINPQDNGANAIVVTTCAEDLDEQHEAGDIFKQVGRAITQTMLTAPASR